MRSAFCNHVGSHLEQLALFSTGAHHQPADSQDSKSVSVDADAFTERAEAIRFHLSNVENTGAADIDISFNKVEKAFSEALPRLKNSNRPNFRVTLSLLVEEMLLSFKEFRLIKTTFPTIDPGFAQQLAIQDLCLVFEQCQHFADEYLQENAIPAGDQEQNISTEVNGELAQEKLVALHQSINRKLDTLHDVLANAESQ
jgi:hypothetical protein